MEWNPEEEEEEEQQGEELICDVRNVRLFAQLAAAVLPHGGGGGGTASSLSSSSSAAGAAASPSAALLFDWGDGGGPAGAAAPGARAACSERDASGCLYVQRRGRDLLLRGATSSRDVYSELRLPASFFSAVEHVPRRKSGRRQAAAAAAGTEAAVRSPSCNGSLQQQQPRGRRGRRRRTSSSDEDIAAAAAGTAAWQRHPLAAGPQEKEGEEEGAESRIATPPGRPRGDIAARAAAAPELADAQQTNRQTQQDKEEDEEETAEVMIPARELLSALILFGEGTFLRLRFAFDEGLLCLTLHEGSSSNTAEAPGFPAATTALSEGEALSEIYIRTFLVTEHERLPSFSSLRAAAKRRKDGASGVSAAPPESLRMSPLIFREVLVDLLLATEEESGAVSSGTELLLCVTPPGSAPVLPAAGGAAAASLAAAAARACDRPSASLAPGGGTGSRPSACEGTAAAAAGSWQRQQQELQQKRLHAQQLQQVQVEDDVAGDDPGGLGEPLMRFSTRQASLSQQIDLRMHPQLFSWVELTQVHKHRYKLKSFLSTVPALKLAQGLRLQWLEEGLLLLQFLIKPAGRTRLFLHVHICPLAAAEAH